MTPFFMNCYVIRDHGEALVIDPGEATDELKRSVDGFKVRAIVNTHCHCDHCGGNAGMAAYTGAELVCHKDDLPLLSIVEQQGAMFGFQCPSSPPPNRYLSEGDTVVVGKVTLNVLHTPGHAPGHIVLVGDGFVIAGDVLFAGSIGRTDLPGGSYEQLLESIRTKLLPLPDNTVVYSGHGPSTTIGIERRSNPFLVGL
ncbi:MAG: MBL fold metallo-hydrolase [Candidatus Hydrogenedentes bacterium]|nr:MBL fold metallo-hydrolase [Candidatus Hydrogenedentota bacterium]